MARSGDNHMKLQLHRVGLDGKGDERLTDPAFNHTVNIAPDGKHFVDVVADARHAARDAAARRATARSIAELREERHDASSTQLGLKQVELFTYKAADGEDGAARHAAQAVELRPDEEVSGARDGLRRPGDERRARDVHDAERR